MRSRGKNPYDTLGYDGSTKVNVTEYRGALWVYVADDKQWSYTFHNQNGSFQFPTDVQ